MYSRLTVLTAYVCNISDFTLLLRLPTRSLSGNDLKDEGCTSLAAALEKNTVLVELDLKGCGIGPSGGEALGKALSTNGTLQRLRCAPPLPPWLAVTWGGSHLFVALPWSTL